MQLLRQARSDRNVELAVFPCGQWISGARGTTSRGHDSEIHLVAGFRRWGEPDLVLAKPAE